MWTLLSLGLYNTSAVLHYLQCRDAPFDSSNLFITRLLIFCFANKWSLIVQTFLQRQVTIHKHTLTTSYPSTHGRSGLSNYYRNGRYGSSMPNVTVVVPEFERPISLLYSSLGTFQFAGNLYYYVFLL